MMFKTRVTFQKILISAAVFSICLISASCASATSLLSPHNSTQKSSSTTPCIRITPDANDDFSQGGNVVNKKAGSTLKVNWLIDENPSTNSSTEEDKVVKATIQVKLFGPFTNIQAIKDLGPGPIQEPEVATSNVISINSCSSTSKVTELPFPKNLKAGYYDVFFNVSSLYRSGSSDGSEVHNPVQISK